jgi:hypothetical protein
MFGLRLPFTGLVCRCIWRAATNLGAWSAQDLCGLSESFLGLDRKADGNLRRPVENLNEMTAKQAMEFALDSAARTQLQAAIAGMAVRTDDIRFFHRSNMGPRNRFSSQDHCHNQQIDGAVTDLSAVRNGNSNPFSDSGREDPAPRGWRYAST